MTTPRAAAPAIVWFRRDLRVHDHPALIDAIARHERIVPVFVFDLRLVHGRFASPNRTWFLIGCVRALDAALAARGARLDVRVGDPRAVIPALADEVGAGAVFVSRDPSPFGRGRDRSIADALAARGVAFHPERGILVHEPDDLRTRDGAAFSVFSPFRRAWERLDRRSVLDAPAEIPTIAGGTSGIGATPTLSELGLGDGPTADPEALPEPGEPAARERLERWLAGPVERYDRTRDRLDDQAGTSRLSQDLHLGTVSPLEVVERAIGPGPGRDRFVQELVWRDFYGHVLSQRPEVLRSAFRPEFDGLPWSDDPARLAAWRDGRTGYPIVDAGMRQLAATGWMHNRARMLAASFLTKHLLVDWRSGEAQFMHHLVDGDVASNNGGWQWSASTGTDSQPYFRIFNPVLQGRRFDPAGRYVRRWVPELAGVTDERIHAPWEMTDDEQRAAGCRVGVDYPGPIVDHAAARARALATYEAARRTS